MNILFIHEVDWLDKVVFDIHTLAEGLSLRGHKIYAIDYPDKWKRKHAFDLVQFKMRETKGVSRAFTGSSVDVFHPGFIKIAGLSRLSAFFTHCCAIRKIIKEKAIDTIVLYSVPTNGLQAVCLARRFKIPLVFRSIDMLHILVPFPPLRPVTKLLERLVYSKVDMILPNTPQYLKYVLNLGAKDDNVKLLAPQIDTELFHPGVDSSEVRQKWGLKEKEPLIVFIGTLFDFCGLDEFVTAFPRLLKQVPDAKLLIVGDGVLRPKLERLIAELNLQGEVIITGFQPYQTMPHYINLATICINTFLITEKTNDIFPGKMMQYVACGKATVATALRGVAALLPGESHGVIYADSPTKMIPEVVTLLLSPERRKKLGEAGLNQIRDKYNVEQITKELETILAKAIERTGK